LALRKESAVTNFLKANTSRFEGREKTQHTILFLYIPTIGVPTETKVKELYVKVEMTRDKFFRKKSSLPNMIRK